MEYDIGLAEGARANLTSMTGRQAQARVVTGDARDADFSGATIAYMYNPFGAEIMRAVLAKLAAMPGLTIVYANPVHEAVFSEFPRLTKAETFLAPYDLGRMPVQIWRVRG